MMGIGKVIEVVNNRGSLSGWGGDYCGLINAEFPPDSFVEHHGSIAPFYGGISTNGRDRMVIATSHVNQAVARGIYLFMVKNGN